MDDSGPEVTFMFQFGFVRDAITVPQSTLNLKTIKNLACDFLNSKVCYFNNFCICGCNIVMGVGS